MEQLAPPTFSFLLFFRYCSPNKPVLNPNSGQGLNKIYFNVYVFEVFSNVEKYCPMTTKLSKVLPSLRIYFSDQIKRMVRHFHFVRFCLDLFFSIITFNEDWSKQFLCLHTSYPIRSQKNKSMSPIQNYIAYFEEDLEGCIKVDWPWLISSTHLKGTCVRPWSAIM